MPFTPPDLPVTEALPKLLDTLSAGRNAVLVAPPGAGKTTVVPLAMLDARWRGDGRILLLEPRRIAARAAARRMAAMLGEEPGDTVGYAMRLESRMSARTRLVIATEGVLARMIVDDPELKGISAIVFDEFHERSLDADFGLALALDVQGALRPDLRLLVMSATIDGARVARLLGDAEVVESAGRSHPIELRHVERAPGTRIEEAVAAACRTMIAEEPGSVLAFLPGQREIERTAEQLAGRLPDTVDVTPLYGGLDGKAQDAAIRPAPAGRRKLVLATSIAETSITIEDVRVVVDSGLSRLPRYEPATGLTRLETVRVSRASANQRAGRAGRTQPGVAVRLWRAEQTAALPAFTPPEILEADLSGLVLDCAAFGIADPTTLSFLDPPPAPALAEARALLTELGAIDADDRLTEAGAAMRKLGLPARLAHMVVEGGRRGEAEGAARLAVLLTERGLGGTMADLDARLQRFRSERGPRAETARKMAERLGRAVSLPLEGRVAAKRPGGVVAAELGLDRLASSQQVEFTPPVQPPPAVVHPPLEGEGKSLSTGALLLFAYPDRVAKARGELGRYVLANGRGAVLDLADPLAREEWLVVADLQGAAQNARIASAAAIGEDEVRTLLADRLGTERETQFDAARGAVRVREVSRLGAIRLAERNLPAPIGADADRAVLDAIRANGLGILDWAKGPEQLRRRLAWLHRGLGEPWPAMNDAALVASLDTWLAPFLRGKATLALVDAQALSDGLMSLVPHHLQRKAAALAPTHYSAPSGSSVPIRYDEDDAVLAIRVQELFGLDRHPAIADGTVPLTLELLSPAHRPIQTTRDLPGFWRGSWADVRADMRGRYPKHHWPENPLEAQATNRAKPRAK